MKLKCPACNYEPNEDNILFIDIRGSSLQMRDNQNRLKSVNLIGCPKCKNIFME